MKCSTRNTEGLSSVSTVSYPLLIISISGCPLLVWWQIPTMCEPSTPSRVGRDSPHPLNANRPRPSGSVLAVVKRFGLPHPGACRWSSDANERVTGKTKTQMRRIRHRPSCCSRRNSHDASLHMQSICKNSKKSPTGVCRTPTNIDGSL